MVIDRPQRYGCVFFFFFWCWERAEAYVYMGSRRMEDRWVWMCVCICVWMSLCEFVYLYVYVSGWVPGWVPAGFEKLVMGVLSSGRKASESFWSFLSSVYLIQLGLSFQGLDPRDRWIMGNGLWSTFLFLGLLGLTCSLHMSCEWLHMNVCRYAFLYAQMTDLLETLSRIRLSASLPACRFVCVGGWWLLAGQAKH